MKRLFLIALLAAAMTAACGSPALPAPEPTAEVVAEVTQEATPEVTAPDTANPGWIGVTRPRPDYPGWEFEHPEGWEVVNLDANNVFLYSAADAGDRLFGTGMQPGDMVFQLSLNRAANADETPDNHLAVLTGTLRDTVFSAPQPVSIGGLEGIQQTGVNETLGFTVIASSRLLMRSTFVDIFAYSRTDEYDASFPVMNAVIEAARYSLATE